MPNQKLIAPTEIILASLRNLITNVRLYGEFAGWIVALGIFLWGVSLLFQRAIPDQTVASSLLMLVRLPVSLVMIAVTAAVIDATAKILQRRRANLLESMNVGVHKLISFVWVSLLTTFAILAGPILAIPIFLAALRWSNGGWTNILCYGILLPLAAFLLAAPPIIYAIRYAFATQSLVVDDIHGTQALKQSSRLVAGRWWSVFLRIVIPSLFFVLASELALAVIFLVTGAILGDPGLFFGLSTNFTGLLTLHALIFIAISYAVYGFALPLYVNAMLLLWFDLKKKRPN